MNKVKFRSKDGLEGEFTVPGANYQVRMCSDGSERVYRLEAYHNPAMPSGREFIYVENAEHRPVLLPGDPVEVAKERDALKRELENLKRGYQAEMADLRGKYDHAHEYNVAIVAENAFLKREIERLGPRKKGI